MSAPDGEDDHGASAERTRLAWRRTGLSATVVALLILRPAFVPGPGVGTVLAVAAAMGVWATLVGLGYRRVHGLIARPPRPGSRTVVAYALLCASFAAFGAVVVLA
ncbi:uncharacterized membrane protein YidH (DUF202 family) [Krasilnikovia cinnamomea]|uniref:Uncharacterized membrane protein YidH (DUF202 family) n=1 Tax=Krasilnikovia cinnamomea TaxID=349313 RepID=A0A4Q7ZGJ4_9ACTN|nr:DUF202 domain-containing protein [Krasilnikovia cinnamomea]RZU49868.1 uncharacterized membrane protein YidH (DUF202 family) [Krasilnikovia cinnamomea]